MGTLSASSGFACSVKPNILSTSTRGLVIGNECKTCPFLGDWRWEEGTYSGFYFQSNALHFELKGVGQQALGKGGIFSRVRINYKTSKSILMLLPAWLGHHHRSDHC